MKRIQDKLQLNKIGPSFSRLRSNDPTLTTLYLSYNQIDDSEASGLAAALQHNSTLTSLDLSGNSIGASGASWLAAALQHNSTLTSLDLSHNNFGDDGISNFAGVISCLNLVHLSLGNTACRDLGFQALVSALFSRSTSSHPSFQLDLRNHSYLRGSPNTITTLPLELANVECLIQLNLDGITSLTDPPYDEVKRTNWHFPAIRRLVQLHKLPRGPMKRTRCLFLGDGAVGKTTLITAICPDSSPSSFREVQRVAGNKSTHLLETRELLFQRREGGFWFFPIVSSCA